MTGKVGRKIFFLTKPTNILILVIDFGIEGIFKKKKKKGSKPYIDFCFIHSVYVINGTEVTDLFPLT